MVEQEGENTSGPYGSLILPLFAVFLVAAIVTAPFMLLRDWSRRIFRKE